MLVILAALALFATACSAQVARAEPAAPKAATYEAMLGESVNKKAVADFIASNCTPSGSLQVCQPAGLALWTDADQIVRIAYLYIDNAEGFAAYKGKLPFGLTANDTMADVEYKLGHPKVIHAPQAGWEPGLPDEGYSRDHTTYLAIYKRFGLALVYNTPASIDKGATIKVILISK